MTLLDNVKSKFSSLLGIYPEKHKYLTENLKKNKINYDKNKIQDGFIISEIPPEGILHLCTFKTPIILNI